MAEQWYDYAGDPAAEARWEQWNSLPDLPEAGENRAFDTWLAEKGLDRADLVRVGARWGSLGGRAALVYLFPDGLKWRALTGERASEQGVKWERSKIIPAQEGPATELIIAEGETDGALLSRVARFCDVAILPAGAKHVPDKDDFSQYSRVYVALDADEAGDSGAEALLDRLPHAVRVRPQGGKDWCELRITEWTPERWIVKRERRTFSVREVIEADLGSDEENNWFDHDICPVGGEIVIHGAIKSLKSVITMEMLRAIATGTAFAGYYDFCRPAGPGRVLVFQYEIPPRGFQRRLMGMARNMPEAERELFFDNLYVYRVADRVMPRLKMQSAGFVAEIRRAIEESGAEVVAFDPIQRMTGGANIDKAHEMEPVLDMFHQLQSSGLTVIYTHHDIKSATKGAADAYNMAGTQRFGADADAICNVYYDPKVMIEDENMGGIKQRNFAWTLRNGVAIGRSVTASPDPTDPDFMHVTYAEPITTIPKGSGYNPDIPDEYPEIK
jgi:hypothetical protein